MSRPYYNKLISGRLNGPHKISRALVYSLVSLLVNQALIIMSHNHYVPLQVCNGHCARLHEFTFTHCSRFTYFLPRDGAMRKRGLCCCRVSVCPSVCHVRVLYPDGWRYR